jgi:hypothetical protein
MFVAALFVIAKLWKQDIPLPMNVLRKCGIYTQVEFYSATKKNEILSFTTKWMELENIILSKVSQVQKAKNHVLCHMQIIDLKQMQ